jgi:signal transduction histidine kinase
VARILHIGDDPNSQETVRALLTEAGHHIIAARSGLEGTKLAKAQKPDLVLVDINSRDLDGYEVTLRLRGLPSVKSVPIVTIGTGEEPETTLALGADGFIKKPVDKDHFAATIARFLSGYRERTDYDATEILRAQLQNTVERFERKVGELLDVNQTLEEMARLRREFLRNFTHEFATPMTPVVGYLRLLLNEEMGPLTPLQRKCLESINNSTQKLRALIDTLLDVSALEMGRLHLYERQYDFIAVVGKAIEETDRLFSEHGISLIEEQHSNDMPARGDSDKLRRAMVHIIDNAVKFTPRGGEVGIAARVIPGRTANEDTYQFIVADSGSGISGEEVKKILEPFYQVDGSVTRSHGGVGLGLAFARHVAEAMGGGIEIQSPPQCQVGNKTFSGTAVVLSVKMFPEIGVPKNQANKGT